MSSYLQSFANRFATLDAGSLSRLDELYSDTIVFRDPLHEINGLPALRAYFDQLYANAQDIRYDFHDLDEVGAGRGYLRWTLHFRHPRLEGGKLISLDGCSHLRWTDRVHFHRDYFDAGALLYEHLPVMGSLIGWLKGRLA
ncbi:MULTISPECIES: nuclear transport factor 2 family protein [unclassified Pseudomonas]|uniref:nuclear transport factor 2 family protein n=1 Tax=unclassified Pseudomonas TaxID=196821 RepID=UPI0021C6E2AD|nr:MULTISPECIES: nuclear transport factor 2 family protein [unclassified Pseudomonas]MCU1732316.1 nuclear transport factor 2 family protein [Pseudomonas sp. 20P_3.2_Bac4]MCU1746671.1 nuclear transport factor 2 family protein [Pseudomonas sp. 20P_3.2_Bac5]